MEFRADFVERLKACLDEADDWYAVERCFRDKVDDEEVEDAKPLVWAFGYMLVGRRREEPRERSGVFAPQWEMGGTTFPPRLTELPEAVAPSLAEYVTALEGQLLATSRLNDLLWVLRHGERPVDYARAAIDAYLQAVDQLETMDLVDSLSRAMEIASEIGDDEQIAAVVERAIDVIEAEIANTDERRPGRPMNLLEDLAVLQPERRPQNLMDLITAASDRYGEDPWIAESISELRASILPAEERVELAREQVERWRVEAKKGDGLLRYVHLQHALELARKNGLRQEADAILVELQSITPDDLDLKEISSEIQIPRDKIDPYVKSFGEQESWQAALERFGAQDPPIRAVPDEQAGSEAPLSRIFPTQVIGPQNSLIFDASADPDHGRVDVSRADALRTQLWGSFAVEILETIRDRFGPIDREELVRFFTTDLVDPAVATRVADALLRFFDGDDDASIHVAIPQLEAVIRNASARLGIVVIKNPRGAGTGGVRQLGALLPELRGRIDEAWRRYLMNALTDSLGLNLRDQVSHGLYGPVSRSDAAIVLHIVLHLRLWSVTEANAGSS